MRIITYRMDKNSNLKFSDRNLLIKLNKGSKNPIFERAIFFTTDVFQSSIEAKESLSLSYSPKYAFAFDYDPNSCKGTLYTNEGNPIFGIVNPYVSRVWPAFGHIGGASEFILTDGGGNFRYLFKVFNSKHAILLLITFQFSSESTLCK